MPPEEEYLGTIRAIYPGAISTSEAVDRLINVLGTRLGLAPHQVMSADSICSDDLNLIEYPKRAYEMLGPFKMGGLNGFPFTGLTGMGAFAHHVPADGAVFVFHGPHIGITRNGVAGEVLRPGQATPSACCGAAKAALARLQRGEIRAGEVTELDYQQNTIEQIFLAAERRICGSANPMVEATEVMYEAIEARIDLLASRTRYPSRFVVLMGGIMINADHEAGSFGCIRRLQLLDNKTGACESLLDQWTTASS